MLDSNPRDTPGSAVAPWGRGGIRSPCRASHVRERDGEVPMEASGPIPPPDSPCAVCSKPIRSGSLVVYEHGELFHVACRSRRLALASIEHVDGAQTVGQRAVRLIDDARRSTGRMRRRQTWSLGRMRYRSPSESWRTRFPRRRRRPGSGAALRAWADVPPKSPGKVVQRRVR
jgi:hypothetical protein